MEYNQKKKIACVTGASGMLGYRITKSLLAFGYSVRVLSRKKTFDIPGAELFQGGLEDEQVIREFLTGTDMLFHCAAEVRDESKMHAVNVVGTKNILRIAEDTKIKYLCYMSTAAVIGRTKLKFVDEQTICQPDSIYERSKWEAEKLVMKGIIGCKVVVLRPTQIVDESHPGVVLLPVRASWHDHLKVFLKGAECAYVVHAEDVVAAAIYFIDYPIDRPQCFFVSCDEQPLNTYAGVWALCQARLTGKSMSEIIIPIQLPLFIPYLLRRLLRRNTKNKGNVHYSSDKLRKCGFLFPLGFIGAIDDVIHSKEQLNDESVKR